MASHVHGEKFDASRLGLGTRQERLLPPPPFNISLGVLASSMRGEDEIKHVQIAKKELKHCLICK